MTKKPADLAELVEMISSGRLTTWLDERDAQARAKALAKDIKTWDTPAEREEAQRREAAETEARAYYR